MEDRSTSTVGVCKLTLYGWAMEETFRLVFVTLGTCGIIAYLVHVARTEGTFNRRR
jgi:hypothetical protein